MTKKQFALIFAVWFFVITLLFCTPARAGNTGLVQAQGVNCEDSIKDLAAAVIRVEQLKVMLDGTKDPHARLVLIAEAKAVIALGRSIQMWRVENCRDA